MAKGPECKLALAVESWDVLGSPLIWLVHSTVPMCVGSHMPMPVRQDLLALCLALTISSYHKTR